MKDNNQQEAPIGYVRKPGAAALLGVSTRTIEREASSGRLKKYKVRGCVCFLAADVLRLGDIEKSNPITP